MVVVISMGSELSFGGHRICVRIIGPGFLQPTSLPNIYTETRMFSRRNFALTGLIVAAGIAVTSLLNAQVKPIPVTPDDGKSIRNEDTQIMMQAKLMHSQNILAGLVTQDFKSIEKAAAALSKISLTPPPDLEKAGDKSDEQVYEHFRMEFARLAGQLERMARRKELEATAYVQQNLTATCIACHDYIRDYP